MWLLFRCVGGGRLCRTKNSRSAHRSTRRSGGWVNNMSGWVCRSIDMRIIGCMGWVHGMELVREVDELMRVVVWPGRCLYGWGEGNSTRWFVDLV